MLRIPRIIIYVYIPDLLTAWRTQHPPPTARQQPRTETTPKSRLKPRQSSPRSENNGNQRKMALYIALVDPCKPRTAEKLTKSARNQSLAFSNKNVKKLYNITFFEILAFFAEILTTSKNNHLNRSKTRRPSAGQQRPQTAPSAPSAPRGVNGKI